MTTPTGRRRRAQLANRQNGAMPQDIAPDRKILGRAPGSACCPGGGSICSTLRRSISRSRISRTGSRASRAGTGRPPARIFSRSRSTRCWSTRSRAAAPASTRRARLAILLHDAPEYVIGDMITPFKAVIGDAYKAVEKPAARRDPSALRIAAGAAGRADAADQERRPRRRLSRGDAACGIRRGRGASASSARRRTFRRRSNGIT